MKQKVHPAVVGVIITIAVVAIVVFGFKTATDKPPYPGMNAPNASRAGRTDIAKSPDLSSKPASAEEARKMGIPGVVPPSGH